MTKKTKIGKSNVEVTPIALGANAVGGHNFYNDLDEELEELLIYRETRQTGYTALTQHAQTFKEIFGNDIEVQNPSIEELMIYLEKYKSKSSKPLTLESEDKK